MTACNAALSVNHQISTSILHMQIPQLEKAAFGLLFKKIEIIPLLTLGNTNKKCVTFYTPSKKRKKEALSEIKARVC